MDEVGPASNIHANPMRYADQRTARFVNVTRSALVLGSSQDPNEIDRESLIRKGVELVIRKSGGGAVFLSPNGQLWVDIAIPKGDKYFRCDVSESFEIIGEIFLQALSDLGTEDLQMHAGRLLGSEIAKKVCFAGLGPGEITFEGAKVVGISQRRTSLGSVFQCTVYVRYPFAELLELMPGCASASPGRGYALGLAEISQDLADRENTFVISGLRKRLLEALTTLD